MTAVAHEPPRRSETVVAYWSGPVSWLERLSAASIVAAGHELRIYSHDPDDLVRQGLPVTVLDVREALGPNPMADFFRAQGIPAFYSDYVRLNLIRQAKGVWADLDFVFRQPLPTTRDTGGYLFGWLNANRINNALFAAPAQSDLVRQYWEAINTLPLRVPWATGRIRAERSLEILLGQTMPVRPRHMAIGPRALTYFVHRLGLARHARRKAAFYPLDDDDAHLLTHADDRAARERITAETVAVHAWRGKLWSTGRSAKPPGSSWLGRQCRDFGI